MLLILCPILISNPISFKCCILSESDKSEPVIMCPRLFLGSFFSSQLISGPIYVLTEFNQSINIDLSALTKALLLSSSTLIEMVKL